MLIINRCKDIKKYQLLNYSPLLVPPTSPSPSHPSHHSPRSHPSHSSHHSHCPHRSRPCNSPCPCGSHPISARAARIPLRVSPSLSEFFFKKYFSHFQLTTKNFQKKLRKNLQDKKNAVPLHPQMRQNTVSKQETTRTLT